MQARALPMPNLKKRFSILEEAVLKEFFFTSLIQLIQKSG